MFLSERITALAPARAAFFRLLAQRHDETTQVYPIEPPGFFRIGDSPYGVPSGTYTLCFYTEQHQPMPHHDQILHIDLQGEVHRANQSQLSLHRSGARSAERPALGVGAVAKPALNSPGASESPKTLTAKSERAPEPASADAAGPTDEGDLEFRKYTYAMDLEDRQQEFIKNAAYVTEVGEVFALNRVMRRELMEMQRIIVLNSQQTYKESAQVKGTVQDLLQLQREVLAHAAETMTRPAAPPPDYVGLGHSALATIREIGVALVQRSQPREAGLTGTSAPRPPQLPAPSSATREGAATASEPKADILDKLVSKLRATTDVDIALAMSSPERWKALLDSLTSEERQSGTTPPSAPLQPSPDGKESLR